MREATFSVAAEPSGMEFQESLAITLSSDRPADIYYTVDGSSPSGPDAVRYDAPLTLTEATLLSFVAISEDGEWSVPQAELYQRQAAAVDFRQAARSLRLSSGNVFFQGSPGRSPVDREITFESTGTTRIKIKSVGIGYASAVGAFYQPSAFELVTPVEEGVRLAPSQEVTVSVRYYPSDSFSSAALLIETDSDAVNNGLYVVELWGRIFNW